MSGVVGSGLCVCKVQPGAALFKSDIKMQQRAFAEPGWQAHRRADCWAHLRVSPAFEVTDKLRDSE